MIFESKRLLELAGIKDSEGLLTESSEQKVSETTAEEGSVVESDTNVDLTEDEIRETIREELSSLWSSGQVFGKQKKDANGVTLGFAGIGFKK